VLDPNAILDEIAAAPAAARDRLRTLDDGPVLVAALRLASTDLARQILCDVLGFRHEPSAVDALIDALSASSHKVRSSAADALAKIADRHAGPALLARLELPEPDAGVRRMLAAAVGAVGHREAIPLLTSLLTDPDASLRGSSAWSLGALGATEALPHLEAAIRAEQAGYPAQRMQEAITTLQSVDEAHGNRSLLKP
jgi:HEAT repeat protein